MSNPLHVISEIGKLNSVVLKRPGKEIENLTPGNMKRLLFDDIPYLKAMQEEHDAFADVLRDNDVEVLYLEKLMEESLSSDTLKEQFINQFILESEIKNKKDQEKVNKYLLSLNISELVDTTMTGVRKDTLLGSSFSAFQNSDNESLFLLEPMPNLYYTRDPASVLDYGISLNKMTHRARKRESIYMEYIMKYHPSYKEETIPTWRERDSETSIEGGDILVLSEETLAIGLSERTSLEGIKEMAGLLFGQDSSFTRVVAIEIPHVRAMMHLDTVFTMIDKDAFTIHPGILQENGNIPIHVIEKSGKGVGYSITEKTNLLETLNEVLGKEIRLIPCGDGDPIAAPREQWNDGSNTLAIAPGVVITYDRNYVTNQLLREQGMTVLEIPSSELSRGRGGPRCMSMPMRRSPVK